MHFSRQTHMGILAIFATLCVVLMITTTTTASSLTKPQVLTAGPIHTFNVLQSSNAGEVSKVDRNEGKIAAVLASLFAFGLGMTVVLCFRHHKKLCFAPPSKAAAPVQANVRMDCTGADLAPDDEMIKKQHSILQNEVIINTQTESFYNGGGVAPAVELVPVNVNNQSH